MRKSLARATNRLKDDLPGVRWVRPENMHITLKFLGDVEAEPLREIYEAVETAAAEVEPFELMLDGPDVFPNADRPSVLVVKATATEEMSERLQDLVGRLEKSFSKLGFRPERRRFRPHVTVGRMRRGKNTRRRGNRPRHGVESTTAGEAFMRLLRGIDWPRSPVPVDEIVLFESDLRSDGPLYTPLARSPLGTA